MKRMSKKILISIGLFGFLGASIVSSFNFLNLNSELSTKDIEKVDPTSIIEKEGETISLKVKVEEKNLRALPTAITEKPGPVFRVYPFAFKNDIESSSNVLNEFTKYFDIVGVNPNDTITVTFNSIDNINGVVSGGVSGKMDSTGRPINWNLPFSSSKFSKVSNMTIVAPTEPNFSKIYASSVYIPEKPPTTTPQEPKSIHEIYKINNPLEPVYSGGVETILEPLNLEFDNSKGFLDMKYTIKNYIDSTGALITTPLTTNIIFYGFKIVPGKTELVFDRNYDSSKISASDFASNISINNYKDFFQINNTPTSIPGNTTEVSQINAKSWDDYEGTITLEFGITGPYFDEKLVKQIAETNNPVFITQTISGFLKQTKPVDPMPIIIGASAGVGGIVLIVGIVFLILLIKRKNAEKLRKAKIASKSSISTPTTGVGSSSGGIPSKNIGSSPQGPTMTNKQPIPTSSIPSRVGPTPPIKPPSIQPPKK